MSKCFQDGASHCFVRFNRDTEVCAKCGECRSRILGHGYAGKDDLIQSLESRLALAEELVRRIRFAESELHPKENQRIDWFDLDDAWRDILEGAEAFEQSGRGRDE